MYYKKITVKKKIKKTTKYFKKTIEFINSMCYYKKALRKTEKVKYKLVKKLRQGCRESQLTSLLFCTKNTKIKK